METIKTIAATCRACQGRGYHDSPNVPHSICLACGGTGSETTGNSDVSRQAMQPSEGIGKNGATMAVTICNLCGEGYRFGEPHACRQPSEGIGELIERLCVAVFKGGFGSEQAERLSKILGEPLAEAIAHLAQANKALFDLKNEQAATVEDNCRESQYLLDLLRRDIDLCKSRAVIRAEINRRLGGAVSGETVKQYGVAR